MTSQPAILASVPAHASFLFLQLRHGVDARAAIDELRGLTHSAEVLVGLGSGLIAGVGATIPGLRPMPALVGPSISIPSTPSDLFLRVSGDDPGQVLHRERAALSELPSFRQVDQVSGFVYADSRDLSGYIDGTENPTGAEADRVAISTGGPGLTGSSVVGVQRWVHDLDALGAMSRHQRDHTIGRDQESNDELADAPESAHVKRTAQEDFSPEAFIVRRSMPWRDHRGSGLMFVAFGATFDPFEAQLRRMIGLDDGIVDALFSFTRPVTGGTWWCPPIRDGGLDLRAVTG